MSREITKRKIIIVVPTICLLALGCKNGGTGFLEEYTAVSEEIVRIVDANPTAEGVKQAQNFLDSKTGLLESKFTAGGRKNFVKDMNGKSRVIVPGI